MTKIKVVFQRATALGISIILSFSTSLRPVQANPAILAPIGFCSATAGVGCVLVAVGMVGSVVVYYVWKTSDGKHIKTNAQGQAFGMIDNPDNPDEVGTWEDPLDTRNEAQAESICKSRAKRVNAINYTKYQHPVTQKWICVFTGGTGR
ncbi:hypothetical protein GS682_06190 [Nostoc sp. B(2019)]|nr:hypothetical protein [Nostoc sp. B(2019)]